MERESLKVCDETLIPHTQLMDLQPKQEPAKSHSSLSQV